MSQVTAADLASQQQQQQAGDTGADTGEASGGSNSNGQSRKRVHDGSDAGTPHMTSLQRRPLQCQKRNAYPIKVVCTVMI